MKIRKFLCAKVEISCLGILKISANVCKFWQISRHFLVFQVISRLWHIETPRFLHSMLIVAINGNPEILVKFCQRILKIIANVLKFSLISQYFLVFQVIFRLWHKLSMSTSSITSDPEVFV